MGVKRNTYKIFVENALRGREHTGNQGAYDSIKLSGISGAWNIIPRFVQALSLPQCVTR
jgi:hypothetical protein